MVFGYFGFAGNPEPSRGGMDDNKRESQLGSVASCLLLA